MSIRAKHRTVLSSLIALVVPGMVFSASPATSAPVSTTTTTAAVSTANAAEAVTWRPVFTDHFTGSSLNRTKWTPYTGGQRRASNVIVNNGTVKLRTQRTSSGWTAAGMTSARALHARYGKFMIRARFERGQGTRAVALLWPAAASWPPEIDFFEVAGSDPARTTNLTANHYKADGKHRIQHAPVRADYTKWHTIGVVWSPDKLTYMLDGREVATLTQNIPRQDMWLGLQTATGTGPGAPSGSTPSQVDFEVDWVQIYKRA